MWWWISASMAAAPEGTPALNSQNYKPPFDSRQTLWTESSWIAADTTFLARGFLDYAYHPLVYVDADGHQSNEVSDILELDVLGALHVSRFRLGVMAPVVLTSAGSSVNGGTGLGDLALSGKVGILDSEDALGLAGEIRTNLPTSTIDGPLGDPKAGVEVSAIVDKTLGSWFLGGNLGTYIGPAVELENVNLDDRFSLRAGVGYAFTERSGLSFDLAGQANYSSPISNVASIPAEGLVGGWGRLSRTLVLRGGVGTGLSSGVGTPALRTVLSLGFEPEAVRDTDGDGLYDDVDACVNDPEDKDGYNDADGCPDPSTHLIVDFVDPKGQPVANVSAKLQGEGGHAEGTGSITGDVHPGSYTVDATAAGFKPLQQGLSVPGTPEHKETIQLLWVDGQVHVKVVGPDGKPIDAQWTADAKTWLPVPSGDTTGPLQPGTYTVRVQAEGYKVEEAQVVIAAAAESTVTFTLKPTKVKVTAEAIELKEKVFFDTGKATIKKESFPLLDEVAAVMRAHPEILMIRIEGHTDSRGSSESNQKLSDARAASVRAYLASKGVEEARMSSVGYGEDKPLDPALTTAAYDKNRRVEIHIEKRAP